MTAAQPLPRDAARAAREARVLEVAGELFYARGVHEVGMDELVGATGMGKASVYRLFPTKNELIGAYLRRLRARILELIDAEASTRPADPAGALRAIFAAIAADLARPGFRGCPFNNASVEFADPAHPAREAARGYREALLQRLTALAIDLDPARGKLLAERLALIIDGMYTSAAHLGAGGPAAAGPALAAALIEEARRG